MPGSSYQSAIDSYAAFFKETTWGTYPSSGATNATFIEFLSNNFKTEIEGRKLDTIGNRPFTKRVQLNKTVQGSLETYLHPIESPLLIAQALGGGVITSSLTGAYTHSFGAGLMDTGPTGISFNVKKGDTTFQYVGGRVNSMKITASINEPVMISYDFVFKDSSQGSFDISSSLSISTLAPFTFVDGVYRYADTETNAATTTSEEAITSFELTVNNNLISDANARQLGSRILSVLPPTRKNVEFKVTQRFDTTTVYSRFTSATIGAVELKFTGSTITADKNYEMTVRMPKVYLNSPDPEIAGPNEILMSEITYDVVADTGTSSGREIGMTVINNVASY